MKLPKHENPRQDVALAPYNFVPLPETAFIVPVEELPDQGLFYTRPEPDSEARFTGEIVCALTTESPLYVRGPFTPEEFDRQEQKEEKERPWREQMRNKPDFFYTDPTDPAKPPRIPGSSLRGMVRALVEIVGYGKVRDVPEHPLVYRAVGDTTEHGAKYRERIMRADGEGYNREGKRCWQYTPKVKAGYMEQTGDGDWRIRPARAIGGTTFARLAMDDRLPRGLERINDCRNAYRIFAQPGPYEYADVRGGFLRIKKSRVLRYSDRPGPGLEACCLAISGDMASKRTEAVVFPPDNAPGAAVVLIQDALVRQYRDQISAEQERLLGKGGVLKDGQPVFYLMEKVERTENGERVAKEELTFFGHTMMLRIPYQQSPLDMVPAYLKDETKIDLAEAIFGYTRRQGVGKARSYASRVSVSDAALEEGQADIWLIPDGGVLTPRILGGPKPTTFQHYLVQPQPDLVEIGRTSKGTPRMEKPLADYEGKLDKTTLRGHKLYWHKGAREAADLQERLDKLRDRRNANQEDSNDTQHTQIKPVKAGVRFRFTVRFENLSAVELGALLWALALPGEEGKEYRQSLGMGKSYGMGAVKITPTLRLDDRDARYATVFDDAGGWQVGRGVADGRMAGFIAAFDERIRKAIGAGNVASLAQVDRIRMLLKLLEWPGPDPRLTRYLEIEHREPENSPMKVNEYKGRPVLPDPLRVATPRLPQPTARPGEAARQPGRPAPIHTSQPAVRPVQPAPPLPKPEPKPAPKPVELSHPKSADEVVEGMYVEGTVKRVESARVVIEICGAEASLSRDAITPPLKDTRDERTRFPPGQMVRVWVKGRNKAGRIQLTTVRP